MKAVVFDAESTGFNEGRIIEEAHCLVDIQEGRLVRLTDITSELFDPEKPIEYGAMATHHLMPEDLEGSRPYSCFALPEETDYLIGHNIDYDWDLIGRPEVKRICTLALARSLWPDVSHTQGALLYMLDPDLARSLAGKAHRAAVDVLVLTNILREIVVRLSVKTIDELYQESEAARIPKVMTVGKHKGVAIKDLPRDYINWFLRQPDVDPYLKQAFLAV
jgi:exodeoxyribonuclease X